MTLPFRPTILSTILMALACGGPGPDVEPDAESAPVAGGTAIVGASADFDALNELSATSAITDQVIGHLLFQNLLRYDENLDYAPALADSFWVAEDGLSATFRIREGVTWHDGVPVTADDIVWSFDMSMLDETAYPRSEERRVGKECRSRWTPYHSKKNEVGAAKAVSLPPARTAGMISMMCCWAWPRAWEDWRGRRGRAVPDRAVTRGVRVCSRDRSRQ